MTASEYQACAGRIGAAGFTARGGFHVEERDGVPGTGGSDRSLVLIGSAGPAFWTAFQRSPEYRDGKPEPMNRWSERVISRLGGELGAQAVFPFKGPPYHPFLRWAARAQTVSPSPLGMLIHPEYGLWHAYRGALIFNRLLEGLPPRTDDESPCLTCEDQPCLGGCPVDAFGPGGFNVGACTDHLLGDNDCEHHGCLARNACPAGKPFRYMREQHSFHLAAFLRARKRERE